MGHHALPAQNDFFTAALSQETSVSITALRKSWRAQVINTLAEIAANLELQAKGNLTELAATGYDLKKKPHRTGAPTETPGNLRLAVTGISGEILARCQASQSARTYHGEHSLGAGGPWTQIDPSTNSKHILFTGLERGKDIYIRVRAFGPNGYSGWSDIATLMVV